MPGACLTHIQPVLPTQIKEKMLHSNPSSRCCWDNRAIPTPSWILMRDVLMGAVAASATWAGSALSPHCVQAAEEKNGDINL